MVLFAASILIAKLHIDTKIGKAQTSPSIVLESAFGKENLIPIVIIGSGPAGLTGAIYGRRGGVRTIVIEGDEPGGLLTKTTDVENWPGERTILGPNLIKKMHQQAKELGVEFVADLVERIDISSWPYRVITQEGVTYHAMAILVATGATPKKLGVPGEEKYWGRGVSSCAVCDAAFFKDKHVVVVGGGDSAVEQAFQLLPYVKSVKLLVRKDSMRAAQTLQDRLKEQPKITVSYASQPREIVGDGKAVTGIKVYDAKAAKETLLAIDGVFLAIGHDPNTALVKGIVPLDASGYIVMEGRTQHTKIEGIFAAGEVEDYRYKQAIVSAGRGAQAALDALAFLGDIGYTPGLELTKAAKKKSHKGGAQEGIKSAFIELPEIICAKELDNLISNSKIPILLDFYTKPCSLCKQLLPAVVELQQEMQDKLCVYKVDAELADDVACRFNVRKVPTFILIDTKGNVSRSHAITSKKGLADFIAA